jgi:hypothetical protein
LFFTAPRYRDGFDFGDEELFVRIEAYLDQSVSLQSGRSFGEWQNFRLQVDNLLKGG